MKYTFTLLCLWLTMQVEANIHRFLLPQNNYFFNSDTVSFAWNDVDSVTFYELQVSTDSNFTVNNTTYSTTSNNLKLAFMTAGNYYWRVRAFTNVYKPWTSRRNLKKVSLSALSTVLWLDAGQINQANNSVVTTWMDMSGIGNNGNASSLGGAKLNLNVFGSRSALNFASNSYDFGNKFTFNGNMSFSIVIKPSKTGGFQTYFAKSINSQGGIYLGHAGANQLNVFSDVEQKVGPGAPDEMDSVPAIVTGTFKNATDTIFMFKNGQPYFNYKVSTDFLGSNSSPFTVGSVANSLPMTGFIAEVILYNKCLTPNERSDVDNYLLNKYAPDVSLGRDVKTCASVYNITPTEKYVKYLWSTGDTTPSINVSTTGNYWVRARDIFNRFSFDTIFVQFDTVDYKPKLPNDTFVCKGTLYALNAGPSHYTYTWNTGETTPAKVVNASGTYIVSVKNCKNNTYRDTIVLFVSDNKPNLPDTSFYCFNGNVTLDPLLNKTSLSYLWNTGASTKTLTVNNVGQYILRVTDSLSCVFRDTVWVNIDSTLKAVSLGPDISLCNGNKIALVVGSPAINKYLWNNGDSSATIPATITQTYWVEVSNAKGCKKRDSININILGFAPNIKLNAKYRCEGDNTLFEDLSTAPVGNTISSRKWKFTPNDSNSAAISIFNFGTKGMKMVSFRVTTNVGCSADTTFGVYIYGKPKAAFANGINCAQSNVLFNNLSTYDPLDSESTWFWSFGDGDTSKLKFPAHSFDSSKTYLVTHYVISKNQCVDTIRKNIQVYPEIKLDFDVLNSCSSDTTYFNANPLSKSIVRYNWSFGNSKSSSGKNTANVYAASGKYDVFVAVENAIGCLDTFRKAVDIVSKPVVNILSDKGCLGKRFEFADKIMISPLDSVVQYKWIINSKDTLLSKSPIYYFKDTGKYDLRYEVKTKLGCYNVANKTALIGLTPTAKFNYTGSIGNVPVDLVFHNASTNALLYKWTIAGKDTFTDTVVNYRFQEFGKYKIALQASNLAGCSDVYTSEIDLSATNLDVMLDKLSLSEFVDNNKNSMFTISLRINNISSRAIRNLELLITDGIGTRYQESWSGLLEPGKSEIIVLRSKPLYTQETKRTFFCAEAVTVNNGEVEKSILNNKVCNNILLETVCQVFPIPVKDEIQIAVTASEEKLLKISIFNSKGTEIARDVLLKTQKGLNVLKWNAATLERDFYIMKIKDSDFEQIIKFVLD